MKAGYIFLGTLVVILSAVVVYLVYVKPSTQPPVIIVEKEAPLPTWVPWNWGWARNPDTVYVSRPVPHFYPMPQHQHPAITSDPYKKPLPMPQTPVPPPDAQPPHQPQPPPLPQPQNNP